MSFAIIAILNYECHFIPLLWSNIYTGAINTILIQILYSYITGFIFYFIMEYRGQYKRRISILPIINNSTHDILFKSEYLITEICRASKKSDVNYPISSEEFYKFCDALTIHNIFVKVWYYKKCSFYDYVKRSCEDIKTSTDALLSHSDLLDENWINKITRVNMFIDHILRTINLNEKSSKLDLVKGWIWYLYFAAKELLVLSNQYDTEYGKSNSELNPKLGHYNKLSFEANVSR